MTPHPDVAGGRYRQAEFAADLWHVHLDEGSDEYRDPIEVFRRTYLTDGLKRLLRHFPIYATGKMGSSVRKMDKAGTSRCRL